MQKPELLAPAGSLQKLKIGLQYGADAFYLGASPFSMRSRTNEFTVEDLLEGMSLIRKAGKAAYITMNINPRAVKMEAFKKHIQFLKKEVKPDAAIVADAGVFDMIREYYPELPIHMSVQANILNYRAVEFWQRNGAARIILPRELSLLEIKAIHEKVPRMELEFFVHGAICMAFSGRCLISNYTTDRDSNQGMCAHSCRWKYKFHDDFSMKRRQEQLANQVDEGGMTYLEEAERPGEFFPVEEDEHGTYIMNSKDMCLIEYLKELKAAGICSFKIEGRNKTEYYLATVTRAYRQAIDDMEKGKKFDKRLLDEVLKVANRGYIPGFLFGFEGGGDVDYEKNSPHQTHKFVGMIVGERDKKGLYEVDVKNRVEKGSVVEVMTPEKQFEMKLEEIFDLEGSELFEAHGGAGVKVFRLKKGLPVGTMVRGR
ncbi:MAG: U32 family peptidase C-terminal domain-containing protein [Candidatus Gracilibacteria bacterium]